MADKICKGNCLECSLQQQIYCSAQFAYEQIRDRQALSDRLAAVEESVKSLKSDFARKELINPFEKEALNGAGAEEKAPEIQNN